ncbi:MAG: DUF2726 domain-containing protein [Sphingomicrobium sp.]
MPPELLALIDHPILLIGVLFVGAMFGMLFEQLVSKQQRAAWKQRKIARGEWVERDRRGPWNAPRHDLLPGTTAGASAGQSRSPDAADQLRTVMGSTFRPKTFLNRGESRVFAALEPLIAELAPGWRVMAQVSLGEVLDADCVEAFNTINAKRVDFLLIDPQMRPRHAIEYQGQGHHQGAAAARDAVKKEALRRAGIGFVEVLAVDTPTELRRVVARLVGAARVGG